MKIAMPDEEVRVVKTYYRESKIILEYGSGGSTVYASKFPNKKITSIESDGAFALKVDDEIRSCNNTKSVPLIIPVDIGETGDWGFPKGAEKWYNFHKYANHPWDMSNRDHPDVVLIDGRFRVACFLTTLFRITKPTTVLFDDYHDRPNYHEIENVVQPSEMIGRMAIFKIQPMQLPIQALPAIYSSYSDPH